MIPRETNIQQSVQDHVKEHLTTLAYIPKIIDFRDAFPSPDERATPLKKTVVAVGFNFDDGGRMVELGSDLTRRVYTTEFWVFGLTQDIGRNVANVIKEIFEAHWVVQLRDYGTAGSPIFDQLVMLDERGVQVQRQVATDPHLWDMNVYTATVKFEDFYSPSAQAA
jgi:hypothetical protein